MKNVRNHIEYVKGQPRHVREKVAFAAAAGCTALIAFVWLAGSLSAGKFAIKTQPFSDGSEIVAAPAANDSGTNGLAGAAAALPEGEQALGAADAPAHIEIVDAPPAKKEKKAEQTIIPF